MTAQAEHTAPIDVLIAEDDPLIRRSLRGLLERQGYTCIEAEDGLRAVELALSAPPKCVLLDLVMPGLDGLAVARRLRADPRTSAAHIHCLTGLSDPAAREQARQAGCEAFLTKPVAPEVLLRVIRPSAGPAAPEQARQAGGGSDLTESAWLSGTDPTPLLVFLGPAAGARKRRLFLAACCRRIGGTAADYPFRDALRAIERLADGQTTAAEVGRTAALAEAQSGLLEPGWLAVAIALDALPDAAAAAGAAGFAAVEAAGVGEPGSAVFEALLATERAAQAELVREVMGNPFRPVRPDPAWLGWREGAVRLLAQAAYDGQASELVPVLADALEVAGCTDPDLLGHLRGPGRHVKGCWVLDVLRGLDNPRLPGPAGSPAVAGAPSAPTATARWMTGLTRTEAEELLDWLENQGCTGLEVSCSEGIAFAVRCVCPAGLQLGRDESGRVRLFQA